LDEKGNTRKSLRVIFGFEGFVILVKVGNVVFDLIDLI
jgi:hypothetical protein